MYVEPQQNAISFRTVNMANSAYADFTFYENYFSYYIYGDLQEHDALKCKISMRSAMAVFKAPNLLDKQVETCHIKLQPNASEILFILKYKNSITKSHLLPILDCEILQTTYNKESACNQVSSQPRVLADAVQNFHQHLVEVTLEVSPQKLLLRNYVDDTSGISNTTRTQLALGIGEFDRYAIGSDTTITFCMKEFKAILSFSENVSVPISVYFEAAGRPVVFGLKNPTFEANLVLSTLCSDADTQTETTVTGLRDKSVKKRAPNKRTTRKTNASTSRINSRSAKSSTVINNSTLRAAEIDVPRTQSNSLFSTSNKDRQEKGTSNKDRRSTDNTSEENVHNTPTTSTLSSTRFNKMGSSGKQLVNSVFSTITKRKSNGNDTVKLNQDDDQIDTIGDSVPSSPPPPAKKARLIFQKCFQRTFDPTMLPGYDVVLAEDSDEDNSN